MVVVMSQRSARLVLARMVSTRFLRSLLPKHLAHIKGHDAILNIIPDIWNETIHRQIVDEAVEAIYKLSKQAK